MNSKEFEKRTAADPDTTAGVRDRILNAACKLFYQEGIHAIGIQRLIEEAGIAKASLYAHFPSKDAVIAAYLDRRGAAVRELIEQRVLADHALDARGRLLRLFDLEAEWIERADYRGCPFQNAGGELADATHPAKAVTRMHRAWIRDLIERLARDTGAPDPSALADVLLLLFDGAHATSLVDGPGASARRARWAAEAFLDAVVPRTTPR